MINLCDQFKNLFDPGNALGAFLISFVAGIATSFFGGRKYEKWVSKKDNIIESDKIEGDVSQDVHYKNMVGQGKSIFSNETKINSIKTKEIKGNISQDCDK